MQAVRTLETHFLSLCFLFLVLQVEAAHCKKMKKSAYTYVLPVCGLFSPLSSAETRRKQSV